MNSSRDFPTTEPSFSFLLPRKLISVKKIVPLAKYANVKAEILESKFGKYLRRLGHSIPSNTLKLIEVYGTIQNVNPDDNCGYYSTMVGLNNMCIYIEDIYI